MIADAQLPAAIAGAAAAAGVLGPLMWYLLREMRAAMNGLAREVSDLTLVIAVDIATRPSANTATRDLASQMVKERGERVRRDREST